jgi:hypothetical protein
MIHRGTYRTAAFLLQVLLAGAQHPFQPNLGGNVMRAASTSFTLAAALALWWPAPALACPEEDAALACPAANCVGLQRPAASITQGPAGTSDRKYRWAPNANDLTLDLRKGTFLANQSERLPVHVINGQHTGLYSVGGRIIGQQSRELTWREVKADLDGNGLTLRGPGISTVEGMYFDNVHDAISPIDGVTKWVVKDVYAKYTRDDFVENDQLQPGVIENTLVDGTFVFLSNRPGAAGGGFSCNGRPSDPDLVVEVRNTLVWMQRQPYDGDMNRDPSQDPINDGRGGGAIFKWSNCGGRVVMSNSIILIESITATGGKAAMTFPPGKYTNVTVVWRGAGDYPAALPRGVRMTRDVTVWTKARQAWLTTHGMK